MTTEQKTKLKHFYLKVLEISLAKSSISLTIVSFDKLMPDTIKDKHPGEQTSSQIVLELPDNLADKGNCLYLDNRYTGLKLGDMLPAINTDIDDAIRRNRKEFPECVDKQGYIRLN